MNYLPYIIIFAGLGLFLAYTSRVRRRHAAADIQYAEDLAVGTDVMTTAGLYATIVAINGDGTAQLSIAPGVEVKWAMLALRDVAGLPPDFVSPPPGRLGVDADGEVVDLEKGERSRGADPTA